MPKYAIDYKWQTSAQQCVLSLLRAGAPPPFLELGSANKSNLNIEKTEIKVLTRNNLRKMCNNIFFKLFFILDTKLMGFKKIGVKHSNLSKNAIQTCVFVNEVHA